LVLQLSLLCFDLKSVLWVWLLLAQLLVWR